MIGKNQILIRQTISLCKRFDEDGNFVNLVIRKSEDPPVIQTYFSLSLKNR
jgi:hypothetical protein